MSSRRWIGLSEGKGAVPVDLGLKTLLACGFFDNIHPATQNAGQPRFQFAQAAEIMEATLREAFTQADGDIDIVSRSFATCDRAKQGNTHHPSLAEFPFMRLQRGDNLFPLHASNLAQPSNRGNRQVGAPVQRTAAAVTFFPGIPCMGAFGRLIRFSSS
jgi:hypothetical protein